MSVPMLLNSIRINKRVSSKLVKRGLMFLIGFLGTVRGLPVNKITS